MNSKQIARLQQTTLTGLTQDNHHEMHEQATMQVSFLEGHTKWEINQQLRNYNFLFCLFECQ